MRSQQCCTVNIIPGGDDAMADGQLPRFSPGSRCEVVPKGGGRKARWRKWPVVSASSAADYTPNMIRSCRNGMMDYCAEAYGGVMYLIHCNAVSNLPLLGLTSVHVEIDSRSRESKLTTSRVSLVHLHVSHTTATLPSSTSQTDPCH